MATVAPSWTEILTSLPSNGDGISALTLSVTTSTSGSSRWTWSPSCFSHLSTVPSVTDSPSCGILIGATPIHDPPRSKARDGGDAQNRTGDGAFAELCLTTWLRRRENRRRFYPLAVSSQSSSLAGADVSDEFKEAMAAVPSAGAVVR